MARPKNMMAGGNITRARFVKPDPTKPSTGSAAGSTVIQATSNSQVVGITDVHGREAPIPSVTQSPPYAAADGEAVAVFTLGDEALLEAGTGGFAPGDELKSDTNGCGVKVAAGSVGRIGAIAIQGAAAGELGLVQIVRFDKSGSVS